MLFGSHREAYFYSRRKFCFRGEVSDLQDVVDMAACGVVSTCLDGRQGVTPASPQFTHQWQCASPASSDHLIVRMEPKASAVSVTS
jgi:hypothetical protein